MFFSRSFHLEIPKSSNDHLLKGLLPSRLCSPVLSKSFSRLKIFVILPEKESMVCVVSKANIVMLQPIFNSFDTQKVKKMADFEKKNENFLVHIGGFLIL